MKHLARYDIKDAARYLDIAPSTLRYWESEGLVYAGRNTSNDYRQYTLHELIEASEIAFYRKLGVSIKELKSYHEFTIDSLDAALSRTERSIEERMADLIAVSERLARQRTLNSEAKRLGKVSLQPGTPPFNRLLEIDYTRPTHWRLLVNEPWRYSLIIDAEHPEKIREAIVEAPVLEAIREHIPRNRSQHDNTPKAPRSRQTSDDTAINTPKVLWSSDQVSRHKQCRECLLRVKPSGTASNARDLFEQATKLGMKPSFMLSTYLVTATLSEGGSRWDYYHAWIIEN